MLGMIYGFLIINSLLLFQDGPWTLLGLYLDNIYYYVKFGENQSAILKVTLWKTDGNKFMKWEVGKW